MNTELPNKVADEAFNKVYLNVLPFIEVYTAKNTLDLSEIMGRIGYSVWSIRSILLEPYALGRVEGYIHDWYYAIQYNTIPDRIILAHYSHHNSRYRGLLPSVTRRVFRLWESYFQANIRETILEYNNVRLDRGLNPLDDMAIITQCMTRRIQEYLDINKAYLDHVSKTTYRN